MEKKGTTSREPEIVFWSLDKSHFESSNVEMCTSRITFQEYILEVCGYCSNNGLEFFIRVIRI